MERAGDLLEAFLRLHNISGGEEYVAFFKSWHRIVGTDIAAHTRVTDIKNGALKVEVDHPGWMQLLQMRKDDIVGKVARQYPALEITNLHMRLVSQFSGPGPGTGPASERAAGGAAGNTADEAAGGNAGGTAGSDAGTAPPETPEQSKTAREALERIEDDRLKDTLKRLYRDLKDTDAD